MDACQHRLTGCSLPNLLGKQGKSSLRYRLGIYFITFNKVPSHASTHRFQRCPSVPLNAKGRATETLKLVGIVLRPPTDEKSEGKLEDPACLISGA
eukprot:1161773-Pelagomonas_calceolata.AAC.16